MPAVGQMNEAIRDVEVTGLASDSRAVRRGFLFAAIPGGRLDGRDFIADAVARGASAVLAPTGTQQPADLRRHAVPLITDDNPRRRLALMAARFHATQPETVAAVTGTNGKSSVVGFARQIWSRMGHLAASLGTLGIDAPGRDAGPGLTTPDPVELHHDLAELAHAGISHLALEASSHGLDQFRLDGVRLRAAAFTNLSRDHLDYHGDAETYLKAKLRLFENLLPADGVAVLNADIPEAALLRHVCRNAGHEIRTYGRRGVELRMDDVSPREDGLDLRLTIGARAYEARLPLIGVFQAYNVMAALGLVVGCGDDPDAAVAALSTLEGVRGRMELAARHPNGAPVYVDYAHTPGALAAALTAIRPHVSGRLTVVFGAGGDRDPGKRPLMGEVSARLADAAIVTDDNPRTEDPGAIRAAVLAECAGATEIGDRAEAIYAAIAGLGPEDVAIIAGKGHEQGQIVGTRVLAFDDREVARAAAAALAKGRGR
ncbi:MAG: UDP-N-acetylmuramoyl-L-alanyl-D-glutamate--2,6-diaminopimelate ligase [Alphaproteobacteria bacterium]